MSDCNFHTPWLLCTPKGSWGRLILRAFGNGMPRALRGGSSLKVACRVRAVCVQCKDSSQGFSGVVGCHPKIATFQPTHAECQNSYTPLPPYPGATFFGRGGVGEQNLVGLSPPLCIDLDLGPIPLFPSSLLFGPLGNSLTGVPDCISNFSRSAQGAPPVRIYQFVGRHGLAEKWRFWGDLRQHPGTLVPLLGDHLMTRGVCLKTRGIM